MGETRGRVAVANGVRAFAVLFVSLFHFWQQSWLTPVLRVGGVTLDFSAPVRAGYMLVDVMLLLSGFLLYLPYARGQAFEGVGRFYRNRVARIVPSYLFCILVSLTVALSAGAYADVRAVLADLLAHLTFTHDLFHASSLNTRLGGALWTLAVEAQFYLLFPALARLFRKSPGLTFAGLVLCALLYRALVLGRMEDTALFINRLPAVLDVYALGMLAAYGYARLERCENRWVKLGCALLTLLALWGIWAFLDAQTAIPPGEARRVGQSAKRLPLAALSALLLFSGGASFRVGAKLWDNPLTRFFAGISYNYYLWHATLALWLKQWRVPGYASDNPSASGEWPWQLHYTLLCFALSVALAAALTYGLERPIANRIRKKI